MSFKTQFLKLIFKNKSFAFHFKENFKWNIKMKGNNELIGAKSILFELDIYKIRHSLTVETVFHN